MNTNELITELEKQKELLLDGKFFDQELLEKYLNEATLKKHDEDFEVKDDETEFTLYGASSPKTLQRQLTRIYPYTTKKPNFTRMHSTWGTLYTITHNLTENFHISVNTPTKHKQKIFKQDKAA